MSVHYPGDSTWFSGTLLIITQRYIQCGAVQYMSAAYYLARGTASSSTRLLARPLRADSFTRKALGSNWTWSILSRMIGLDRSSRRVFAVCRLADRLTCHITSLAAIYPSTKLLGLDNSKQRPEGYAFLESSVTWNRKINIYIIMSTYFTVWMDNSVLGEKSPVFINFFFF